MIQTAVHNISNSDEVLVFIIMNEISKLENTTQREKAIEYILFELIKDKSHTKIRKVIDEIRKF